MFVAFRGGGAPVRPPLNTPLGHPYKLFKHQVSSISVRSNFFAERVINALNGFQLPDRLQIISPGVRPKTLSVPTAAQTKTQKTAVLPQKSRTQLHIATYWIFTIKNVFVNRSCDLTTVSWLYVWHSTYFFVFYLCILFFVLLFTVHLCAIDTRFHKRNLLLLISQIPTFATVLHFNC